ncbi:MAG: BrnT family toxin [Aphanizomenon gracile PMC644.10]|nr:BrnT family toxin [Aphanizomenon gracile PMC644.10]
MVYIQNVSTSLMELEWDEHKNQQNQKKHGLSFEEAQEIFQGIVFTSIDERFDYDEEIREITIGAIQGIILVTVAHTQRNGKIRLISARKATPKERRQYYEYLAETS